MNIVLDDLKYSNNVILKNLIFENKIFFAFFDENNVQRITFNNDNISLFENKAVDEIKETQ